MTGPEHYLEAERLLAGAAGDYTITGNRERREGVAHALLALTAVTALMGYDAAPNPSAEWKAWREAIQPAKGGAP